MIMRNRASYKRALNFDDHSNYDALMDKIIEKVIVLKKVFPEYIAQF